MTIKYLIAHDNLDDRREIRHLLERLPPRQQLAFLRRCCQKSVLPHSTCRPAPNAQTIRLVRQAERSEEHARRLAFCIYMDLWALSVQYNLDLDQALNELVEMVRAQR